MHAAAYRPIDRPAAGRPAALAAVSPQGLAVLGALQEAAHGQLPITAVLRAVHRAGTRAPVARASLSRTLRRLWRAGLVELVAEASRSLTGEVQHQQRCAALARSAPEASYQAYVARCRAEGTPLEYFTAVEYVEAWRVSAELRPSLRVQHVVLTERGRKAVNDVAA